MPINLVSAGGGSTTLNPASSGSNFTVTIPAASTTMVGTDTAQTLTNKTIGSGYGGGTVVSGTAVTSTSGTSIDFTGIPSWAKRVTVMFVGVSTNGTSAIQIQIGSSGGVLTSGYLGTGINNITGTSNSLMSSGFLTSATADVGAVTVRHGFFTLTNVTGNTWVMFGSANASNTGIGMYGSGSNSTLGGTLDRIRITTVNGTDTFDAGSINILYE